MSIETANAIAYWATVLSAIAFLCAAGSQAYVLRSWPTVLYLGLFMANTAIAVVATKP